MEIQWYGILGSSMHCSVTLTDHWWSTDTPMSTQVIWHGHETTGFRRLRAMGCTVECSKDGLVLKLNMSLDLDSITPLYRVHVASFPGPAQLFVACSTEKRGGPGIVSPHGHYVIDKRPKFSE